MSRVVYLIPLALEAAILAAMVAGIAAMQEPNTRAAREYVTPGATIAANRSTWLEQNPLLFGLGVGVAVMVIGLLVIIASNSERDR